MVITATVLLTGISGFIAKRIALDLLLSGDRVVGTLRTPGRADEVRASLCAHGVDDEGMARLSFVTADLTADAGWAEAMAGTDAVIHTASPFPLARPKDQDTLIRPAVDGTLRVLRAAEAAGVHRVILTSPIAAVMHGPASGPLTEADRSDLSAPTVDAYTRPKTLAKRAAWDFAAEHPDMRLTVINPGAVMGTPMGVHTGSSVSVVARFLNGKDPMVPNISLPVTDLADVSAAHIAALRQPQSVGQRYIVVDRPNSARAM